MRYGWLLGMLLLLGCASDDAAVRAREIEIAHRTQLILDAVMALPPEQRAAYMLWLELQSQKIPSRAPFQITNCQYIPYTKQTICSTTSW